MASDLEWLKKKEPYHKFQFSLKSPFLMEQEKNDTPVDFSPLVGSEFLKSCNCSKIEGPCAALKSHTHQSMSRALYSSGGLVGLLMYS